MKVEFKCVQCNATTKKQNCFCDGCMKEFLKEAAEDWNQQEVLLDRIEKLDGSILEFWVMTDGTISEFTIKESDMEQKPKEIECSTCGGYGYTQAISMSWTEAQFDEFSCPDCEGYGVIEIQAEMDQSTETNEGEAAKPVIEP